MLRIVLTCSTLVLSGCSLIFMTAPPEHVTAYTSVDCTTGVAAPVIDIIAGVLNGIGTALEADAGAHTGIVIADAGLSALFIGSAVRGFTISSDCAAAKAERDRLLEQQMQQQPRWYPPQQPPPGYYPPPPPPPPPPVWQQTTPREPPPQAGPYGY